MSSGCKTQTWSLKQFLKTIKWDFGDIWSRSTSVSETSPCSTRNERLLGKWRAITEWGHINWQNRYFITVGFSTAAVEFHLNFTIWQWMVDIFQASQKAQLPQTRVLFVYFLKCKCITNLSQLKFLGVKIWRDFYLIIYQRYFVLLKAMV